LFQPYKINGGNHFIANSKDTQAYFKKTARSNSVSLLPNAIDYQKFLNPNLKNGLGRVLKLINIGTFVEKKNQAFLLEVGAVLKKRTIPFEFHLIGNGAKRLELEIRTKNLGLEKEVVFHGIVDRVEEFLWQSDLYVHSATYEPLGLVLLEAMAAGLPVITLDGKGNRDLIIQGKNGYMLFEPDAEKFADKILEIWGNENLYKEMSVFAKEFAKGYDIKEYVVRLLEIYRQPL
jgi:glycosyltransferase involved in cell wall biosynthesis